MTIFAYQLGGVQPCPESQIYYDDKDDQIFVHTGAFTNEITKEMLALKGKQDKQPCVITKDGELFLPLYWMQDACSIPEYTADRIRDDVLRYHEESVKNKTAVPISSDLKLKAKKNGNIIHRPKRAKIQ